MNRKRTKSPVAALRTLKKFVALFRGGTDEAAQRELQAIMRTIDRDPERYQKALDAAIYMMQHPTEQGL